ncbi:MAG: LCP family protein, partial [Patescibacteria group bacterium]|nr:LCP family protein [Patescibacteria group bacterium]
MKIQGKKKKLFWIIALVFVFAGFFSLFFFKAGFTVSRVVGWNGASAILPFSDDLPNLPKKNPNKINILLLGMRGIEEQGEGKLLSDTIILASIKKDTGQIALISLPRDLYARIWCLSKKKKINFAYAHGGFDCAKKTISLVTGLYIDYAVSVNFKALQETIDTLGGISIYRNESFEEDFQWAKEGWEENEYWFIKEIDGEEKWVFHIPEGASKLDGQTALYYARSRYSTDDFDRMRRQQQIILAIKEKFLSLGVLANPVKIYNLMDILGNNAQTDMK